ncbi:hypothetical protein ES288_A07G055900v1 [Gossypium darwinii]|uniref:Uncharacterized protein n=1 Tax=Gossypium darwinii TaxID=34276 RepID=A0A5D2FUC0_GOSDA|nr:hypothetical protein ES288_A07G055900v1 [Gossypium darwinii]
MKEKPHWRRGHGQLWWPWPIVVWRRGRALEAWQTRRPREACGARVWGRQLSAENINVVWARFLIFGPICDWVIIFTRPANLGFYNY